ncbi:MAG: 16S rRNA (guanine(527)-N(7))-methyltransferase RsmG [Desulfobacter sp.]|nr:16S rRNA (guanine(527)-N(7))-methyltransferase RsmG [Desulfobacter sp.]WDP86451.1 MAG: 16S rRNA (guanine(527)-N(7))-methyltransferase RsmG [Desulfobacter sp.]
MNSWVDPFKERLFQGGQALGYELSSKEMGLMADHAEQLMVWNKKINLTAIRNPLEMAEKHFLDAVGVAGLLNGENKILDMGSGGGFPALPLKILNPSLHFSLVDSVRKKVSFLNHVVRTLELEGIKAFHSRVQALALDPDHFKSYDAVMSRGFSGLESFVDYAAPFLTPSGKIYALKGENAQNEITPAVRSRFDIKIDHYLLPFLKADRYLLRLTPK